MQSPLAGEATSHATVLALQRLPSKEVVTTHVRPFAACCARTTVKVTPRRRRSKTKRGAALLPIGGGERKAPRPRARLTADFNHVDSFARSGQHRGLALDHVLNLLGRLGVVEAEVAEVDLGRLECKLQRLAVPGDDYVTGRRRTCRARRAGWRGRPCRTSRGKPPCPSGTSRASQ